MGFISKFSTKPESIGISTISATRGFIEQLIFC